MTRLLTAFRRLIPPFALLLMLVFVLDACTTRRRSNDDDDDTTSSSDDDDSSATGDDDDVVDDDDTTAGDDDDVAPGILAFSADTTTLGPINPGQQDSATMTFENTGGATVSVTLSLTDSSGTWTISGIQLYLSPGQVETRALNFVPASEGEYSVVVRANHDGANESPLELEFLGTTSGASTVETSCTDGIDNDGDSQVDCNDSDCAGDPACTGGGDPCCGAMPGTIGPGPCSNSSVASCVCSTIAYCCQGGGHGEWDSQCADYYSGNLGHCGGSPTCP